MTEISKNQVSVGNNQIMAAFQEDGLLINRQAIQEYEQYEVINVVANQEYSWNFREIGHTIQPINLIAYAPNGVSQSDDIYLRIRDISSGDLIWEIDIANRFTILGNAISYTFPFFTLDPSVIASVESSIGLLALRVYANKVYMNTPSYTGK